MPKEAEFKVNRYLEFLAATRNSIKKLNLFSTYRKLIVGDELSNSVPPDRKLYHFVLSLQQMNC